MAANIEKNRKRDGKFGAGKLPPPATVRSRRGRADDGSGRPALLLGEPPQAAVPEVTPELSLMLRFKPAYRRRGEGDPVFAETAQTRQTVQTRQAPGPVQCEPGDVIVRAERESHRTGSEPAAVYKPEEFAAAYRHNSLNECWMPRVPPGLQLPAKVFQATVIDTSGGPVMAQPGDTVVMEPDGTQRIADDGADYADEFCSFAGARWDSFGDPDGDMDELGLTPGTAAYREHLARLMPVGCCLAVEALDVFSDKRNDDSDEEDHAHESAVLRDVFAVHESNGSVDLFVEAAAEEMGVLLARRRRGLAPEDELDAFCGRLLAHTADGDPMASAVNEARRRATHRHSGYLRTRREKPSGARS